MKMDVEGAELELLTDLLISGALQHVDNVLVEFHTYFEVRFWPTINLSSQKETKVSQTATN
jgi:hypothetical protein